MTGGPGASSGLASALEVALAERPDQNKRSLARVLRAKGVDVDTSLINSVLYAHPDRFGHDSGTPPLWRVHSNESSGRTKGSTASARLRKTIAYSGFEPWAWQSEALAAWERAGGRGIVEAVTGTGKTLVGLLAVRQALERNEKALIIVPTIDLMDQWHQRIRRTLPTVSVGRLGDGSEDGLDRCAVLISTVHSAMRREVLPRGQRGILVADEVHRYGAASFAQALQPSFTSRLGLTATLERSDEGVAEHLNPYFGGIVYKCKFKRAFADGMLAPFRLILMALDLSSAESAEYDKADRTAKTMRWELIAKFDCRDEPFGAFMSDVTTLATGPRQPGRHEARAYLSAANTRRAVVAEANSKLDALRSLRQAIGGSRTLVFTETKAGAAAATEVLQSVGVQAREFHSDLKRDERKEVLELYRSGAVTALAAPRVLDEGIDVPDADLGIILAATSSRRQMVQRMGRILRRKDDGRSATFILMYIRGTFEDPALGRHEVFLADLERFAESIEAI